MKASARYCGSNCRGDAARSRARTKRKKAHLLAASVGGEAPATGQAPSDSPKHVGSMADSESPSAQKDENRILGRKKTQAPPLGRRRANPRRLRQPFTLRVDIREQILNQAPSAATGYGLVLPSVDDGKPPRIVPRRKRGEQRQPYRLTPFDYPLDIRLRDGTWYRIMWFGTDGRQVAPLPNCGIPSLYFFLGTPDRTGTFPIARDGSSPLLPATAAEPKVLMLPTGGMTPATPLDVIAPQSLPQDAVPRQHEASISASLTAIAEPASRAQPDEPTPKRDVQPLHPFWAGEGKCALQLESLAQLLYEQRAAQARDSGQPSPPEPLTQLGREERKKIRRLAEHPRLMRLGGLLRAHFESAKGDGMGAFESLPLDPTPLSEADRQLLLVAAQTPENRRFLDYLHQRGNALLVGEPLPPEPLTTLPDADRKRIKRLLGDLRSIPIMIRNSNAASGR